MDHDMKKNPTSIPVSGDTVLLTAIALKHCISFPGLIPRAHVDYHHHLRRYTVYYTVHMFHMST